MAAASAAAASAEKSGSPGAIESAQTDSGGVPLAPVLARYTEVGLRYKAEKVRDYSAEQALLGYTLDWNVLRGSLPRYHALAQAVRSLERRMWAQPREVERLVGRFTHWFLLHRAAVSSTPSRQRLAGGGLGSGRRFCASCSRLSRCCRWFGVIWRDQRPAL